MISRQPLFRKSKFLSKFSFSFLYPDYNLSPTLERRSLVSATEIEHVISSDREYAGDAFDLKMSMLGSLGMTQAALHS